jgi:hypothetical protein
VNDSDTFALLVCIALLAAGCSSRPANHVEPPTNRVWTEEHRGHLYVFRGYHDGHFLHSPECKCNAKGNEVK